MSPQDQTRVLKNLYRLEQYAKTPESKFCESPPWPKQELFLKLPQLEALYGGAAGGGKSDALLRAALQYVHVPGYSAMIFRTDLPRLKLSGGLIPRSHEWLTGKASWNGGDYRWTFPTGATIQFGYLSNAQDKFRYGSSEYQFIAFDELTEFAEEDYKFMFSRLRKKTSIDVPYRMRSASNPGGRGHEWVKARFITEQAETDLKNDCLQGAYKCVGIDGEEDRVFVPAKIRDNPAVDPVRYAKNLTQLGPVARERLMNGDWTILPTGLFRPEWLRYYTTSGRLLVLLKTEEDREGNVVHTTEAVRRFDERECVRFMTIDAAGGVEDIKNEHKGKQLSYTAAAVWDVKRGDGSMVVCLRHVRRAKGLNYIAMRDMIRQEHDEWKPSKTYVEDKAMGMALVADLSRSFPCEAIKKGTQDKVTHSGPFQSMMEEGRVYLPHGENSWRPQYEGELLRWQGLPDETNDQVDVSSYMAQVCGGFAGGVTRAAVDPRVSTVELVRNRDMKQGGGFMGGWQ